MLFPDLLQYGLVRLLGVLLLRGQGGHIDAVQIEILQALGAVAAGQTGGQGLIQRVLADEGGDGVLVSAHALGLGDILQDAFLVRGQLFGLLHDELLKSRTIPACDLLKVRARRSLPGLAGWTVPQAAVAAGLSRTACRSRDTGGRAGPDGDGTGAGSAPGVAVGAAVFKG